MQLVKVESNLYESCSYCHESVAGTLTDKVNSFKVKLDKERVGAVQIVRNLEIEKPGIPERWWHHGEFDHGSHRVTSCVSCHEGSGGDADPKLRIQPGDSEEVVEQKRKARYEKCSTETADILLPGIDTCMKCHKPEGGASAACVECHLYHDRSKQRSLDGYVSLENLQETIKAGARKNSVWANIFRKEIEKLKLFEEDPSGAGGAEFNEGAKDEGAKDEPAKDEGARDEPAKDEGAKDDGAKDEPAKEGGKDEGAKDEGGTDEGAEDEAPRDEAPKEQAPADKPTDDAKPDGAGE